MKWYNLTSVCSWHNVFCQLLYVYVWYIFLIILQCSFMIFMHSPKTQQISNKYRVCDWEVWWHALIISIYSCGDIHLHPASHSATPLTCTSMWQLLLMQVTGTVAFHPKNDECRILENWGTDSMSVIYRINLLHQVF